MDENRFRLRFSPRNPKSNWSRVNKEKAELLIKENRMKTAGLAMVELAKKTGTWTALDEVENLILPEIMTQLFMKEPLAFANYETFPRSAKRGILEWIYSAKKDATKLKRIEETVALAKENIRANQYNKS